MLFTLGLKLLDRQALALLSFELGEPPPCLRFHGALELMCALLRGEGPPRRGVVGLVAARLIGLLLLLLLLVLLVLLLLLWFWRRAEPPTSAGRGGASILRRALSHLLLAVLAHHRRERGRLLPSLVQLPPERFHIALAGRGVGPLSPLGRGRRGCRQRIAPESRRCRAG